MYFFPLGNFLFPSVRSVRGLSSWEMHVAGSEAKCTKRKQSRYKLRHRHLAYRFDVSVASFAGQCSCPQSEVFVKCWNSANVTGISSADYFERVLICTDLSVEKSKIFPSGLPSTKPQTPGIWEASPCYRRL